MIAALMTYALVIGVVIAAAAFLLERAARLLRLPTRWIWMGSLALLVAVVVMAPTRNSGVAWKVRLDNAAVATSSGSLVASSSVDARALLRTMRELAVAPVERTVRAARAVVSPRVDRWIGALWLASSLGTLGTIIAVFARFRRARRRWPVGRVQGDIVRIAPTGGPAVIGVARPEIVIPQWLLGCTAEEQRLVLAHEREHLRARDHHALLAGCLTLALMPWHPAVWWMLSRLRLAVELDCDARVLRRGIAPHAYGSLLIDLAGRCSSLPVGAPALADESSHLEQRLMAMKPTVARFASLRGAAFAALALLGLVVACESRLPTAAEIEGMDVTAAESRMKTMLPLIRPDSGDILYLVDGMAANEKTVRDLTPEEIAMIEVVRGEPGAESSVNVTTRAFVLKDRLPGYTTRDHLRIRTPNPAAETFNVRVDKEHPTTAIRRFEGLVIVDGNVVAENALAKLDPDRVLSVEVLKGDAAATLYPRLPEAGKGVIRITTRK